MFTNLDTPFFSIKKTTSKPFRNGTSRSEFFTFLKDQKTIFNRQIFLHVKKHVTLLPFYVQGHWLNNLQHDCLPYRDKPTRFLAPYQSTSILCACDGCIRSIVCTSLLHFHDYQHAIHLNLHPSNLCLPCQLYDINQTSQLHLEH